MHSHTARPVKSSERIIGGFVYHDLLPHRSEKRYFYEQRYADSGQTLLIELQNYEQQGISIWLEGFPSSSVEVSEVMCVREDTNYMRDYVFRQGALSQVRFDKITKK